MHKSEIKKQKRKRKKPQKTLHDTNLHLNPSFLWDSGEKSFRLRKKKKKVKKKEKKLTDIL